MTRISVIFASHSLRALVLIAPLVTSCGGSQSSVTTPPSPASSASAPSITPDFSSSVSGQSTTAAMPAGTTWKDMSHAQRMSYMKTKVLPTMKSVFQGFDANQYKTMNCTTCHGEGAREGSFKMPNPDLPKLSVADHFKKHMDKSPDFTKFMMNQVVPQMASLFGEHPFDPKTQQGLGCFVCHTMEK